MNLQAKPQEILTLTLKWKCPYCPESFRYNMNCRNHIKEKHGMENNDE